ncbi:YkgJ family cysteine cluster protein [Bdellovibrio sp. BCCA]|uniref:YkgJ family cysteine cluster protein n=1 Tax=Bdellovibrio sp. BCCA TaxID=3136281 RepID=UPI0030F04872
MNVDSFFAQHKKLTRSLKKFILDYEKELSLDVFEAFLETLSEELKSARIELQKSPAGPSRAKRLHELVENEIAQSANIETSCQKGCSACCHMEVEITSYEAEILGSLVHAGHSIERSRLQRQSQRTLQDPLWREGVRDLSNRCIFLNNEGACSIYENRPVMCRRHSVTSPAKNCETQDGKIVIRYFPKVDLLISAANEDPQVEIGPLAKMLEMKLR